MVWFLMLILLWGMSCFNRGKRGLITLVKNPHHPLNPQIWNKLLVFFFLGERHQALESMDQLYNHCTLPPPPEIYFSFSLGFELSCLFPSLSSVILCKYLCNNSSLTLKGFFLKKATLLLIWQNNSWLIVAYTNGEITLFLIIHSSIKSSSSIQPIRYLWLSWDMDLQLNKFCTSMFQH